MPKCDGFNLCYDLRKIDKKVCIMLCSAYDDSKTRKKAFEVGMDGVLNKPVVKSDLELFLKCLNMK